MRRIFCFVIALSILLAAAGCSGKDKGTKPGSSAPAGQTETNVPDSSSANAAVTENAIESSSEPTVETSAGSPAKIKEELLQSASVDLDADGRNEQVEVLQAELDDPAQPGVTEIEGILRIGGKNGTTDTVFLKKTKSVTGVLDSIEFKDLDGDGIKDVFITIPDAGASFSINYYYIYNYKNGKSYNFNIDASLTDFAGGFLFEYAGKGKLRMKNDNYGFSADFDLTSGAGSYSKDENVNAEYERSWVDSTPVVIGENSKISLTGSGKNIGIKVPLPVFGLAAADMIGEVDMFYNVGEDFTPVMKRFEVFDFDNGMSLRKIGEWVKK